MNKNLNIFTACNNKYVDFTPMFILSNLFFNRNAFVEVCLFKEGLDTIQSSLDCLNELYPNEFLVREIDDITFSPNTQTNSIRFILEPKVKMDYVYISDIDIITLDSSILKTHLDIMSDNKIPYSNIIRENSTRLTGLHFTPWDNYYPIKNIDHLTEYLKHDELFLYHLMIDRFPNLKNKSTLRPVHGIHASPNRKPIDTNVNWGLHDHRKDPWVILTNSDEFKSIYNTLSIRLKDIVFTINNFYSCT
jgi:hypothetical protein